MTNRRKNNACVTDLCGVPMPHKPSKKDLLEILKRLKFKCPPETDAIQAELTAAEKARRVFEKSNETFKKLRKAERMAKCKLEQVRTLWQKEIGDCWSDLLLHGISTALIRRVERLVNGDGS